MVEGQGGSGGGGAAAPDLQALAAQIEGLAKGLAGLQRQPWSLSSFAAGVLLTGAVVWFIWYRYRYSINRLSARHRQQEAVRQLSSLDADELRSLLGGVNLPSWINYPDFQRVQWLNTITAQIWPYAAKYTMSWAQQELPGMLDASKPPWMRSIKLHHFSLGSVPPEPLGVKVFTQAETRNDEVVIDIDFVWAGEQQISFVVRPVPRAATNAVTRLPVLSQAVDMLSNVVIIKVALEKMVMNGRLRLTLRPLMSQLPLIGSAQVAFTETPRFTFDLTVLGGDVAVLPGLETWLHGLIKDSVLQPFVLPEKFIIPLADTGSDTFEKPRGLLRVRVVEAQNVPRMDLLSKSDPFVEVSVRSKRTVKTQVLENTHRPQWDEEFSLLVHYPETQVLNAKVLDYDVFGANDEIGRVELKIADLPTEKEVDEWFDVEPPRQERPASQKYQSAGNPISLAMRWGQKGVGALIRPWDVAQKVTRGRVKHKCRLHLKITWLAFKEEEVDAALAAQMDPRKGGGRGVSGALASASPAVRKALQGGVLCVRIVRVESLTGKPWLVGGWKRSIHVRVWFAGESKRTMSVKGKKEQYNIDQELEFVIGGDVAKGDSRLELEVWDMHWRNAFKGRASLSFKAVRDAKMWRGGLDLQDVAQGRITLEAQWMPAFST